MGGLGTVWKGTAFDCPSSAHGIILLHSRFRDEHGTQGACNNGTIVGQSLRIKDTSYTSQLNVTVSSDMIGESIECFQDDGEVETLVESSTIVPTTGYLCNINCYSILFIHAMYMIHAAPFPSPDRMSISRADVSSKQLIFNWSPVAPDCLAIHYNILASNCGSCPSTTTHTIVTCTDVPTDGSMCTFALQTVVCRNIVGNSSDTIEGILNGMDPSCN